MDIFTRPQTQAELNDFSEAQMLEAAKYFNTLEPSTSDDMFLSTFEHFDVATGLGTIGLFLLGTIVISQALLLILTHNRAR